MAVLHGKKQSGQIKPKLQVLTQYDCNIVTMDSMLPRWYCLYSNSSKPNLKNENIFPTSHFLANLKMTKTSARKWVCCVFGGKPNQIIRKQKNNLKDTTNQKISPTTENQSNIGSLKRKRKLVANENEKPVSKRKCSDPSSFLKAFSFLQNHTENFETFKTVQNFNSTKISISRRLRKTIPIGYTILKQVNSKSCLFLIDVHCPITKFNEFVDYNNLKKIEILTPEIWKKLLSFHCTYHQVFLFLKSVLSKYFPTKLVWGSTQNEKHFYKKVKYLISLRRYDKLFAGHLCKGFNISEIPWLTDGQESEKLLCKFMTWIFMDVIFVILRKFFYITDHADYRNRLLYYRKKVWFAGVNCGIASLINKNIWAPAPMSYKIDQESVFTVRFLPKESGLRPIMKRMIRKSPSHILCLRYLKIFQTIKEKCPKLMGCTTNGISGIHKKWRQFWKRCQLMQNNNDTNHNLYFAKVDIKQCFDRIPTEKLMEIVKFVLDRSRNIKLNVFHKKYFGHFGAGEIIGDYFSKIYNFIKEFLSTITISILNKSFIRLSGIPQGWELSSILCDFFYAHLENSHLLHFAQNMKTKTPTSARLLMRYVDDFLFVSVNQLEVEEFVRVMHIGFPEFGCCVNQKKSLVNFQFIDSKLQEDESINKLQNKNTFPWYGLLFPQAVYCNTKKTTKTDKVTKNIPHVAGVSLDFEKHYLIGNIRDCMSVTTKNEKYPSSYAMYSSINLRIIPLCFDRKVNSKLYILKNLHDLACLSTLLWLAHDANKPYSERSCLFPSKSVHCIQRIATCRVLAVIRKNFPYQKFPNKNMVLWIFYKTFLKQFLLHYDDYKTICALLRKNLHQLNRKIKERENWKKIKPLLDFACSTYPEKLKRVKYK